MQRPNRRPTPLSPPPIPPTDAEPPEEEDRIPSFDDPLDFFLERLRAEQVPIRELRLTPLIEDYLAYVRQAGQTLARRMEWIEMAAVLIRWKSRLLLSRKVRKKTTEADSPYPEELRQSLIRQLLGRARELAEGLNRRRARETRYLTAPATLDQPEEAPEPEIWHAPFYSAWDVIQQAKELRAWVLAHREEQERERNAFVWPTAESSVEEMAVWAEERLRAAPPEFWLSAEPLFEEAGARPRQCCLFLAFLELTRAGRLALAQPRESALLYLFPVREYREE